jgi:hypothetical protein
MPTIISVKGFRIFFVSFDGSEPIHVHAQHGSTSAKVWLDPLRVEWSEFKPHQEREMLRIVSDNAALIREKWHAHFKQR